MARADEWTSPPTEIQLPESRFTMWWAPVTRDGQLIGAVWMADDVTRVPRAGLVNVQSPDGPFQDEFGAITLSLRSGSTIDAAEWLGYLAETRDGYSGRPLVGEPTRCASLDVIRRAMGWDV
jgi:hypothetical protein